MRAMKHMLTVAAAMLLLAASQAPGAAAARFRGLTQFNNLNNGFVGFNNGFGISQSAATAEAQAAAIGNTLAPRLGLGSGGAQCISNAAAQSGASAFTPLGGRSVSNAAAEANAFAVTGGGLNNLAACGASAQAASSALSCSQYRVPYTSNLCGLSNQFGSGCNGLQLINPGVDGLAPGQLINVPPCNF